MTKYMDSLKSSNNKLGAGEGIRTHERLRETILSRSPLTAWLLPHIDIYFYPKYTSIFSIIFRIDSQLILCNYSAFIGNNKITLQLAYITNPVNQ